MQLVWTRRVLAAAAAVACVGLISAPTGSAKDPLPEGGSAKQQDADMAYLKASVDKKAKNTILPVRATALLVAQSAQNRLGGKDDEALAGLRDQMIKLNLALSDDDKLDWKGAAEALEKVKDAKGDKAPVALAKTDKTFDTAVLMDVFKAKKRGGRGWEDDLSEVAKDGKDADLALEIAQGSVLVGQLAETVISDKAANAAQKKQWDGFAKDMQKAGAEAAAEAAKGKKADKDVLAKKMTALEGSCQACHKVFKKAG